MELLSEFDRRLRIMFGKKHFSRVSMMAEKAIAFRRWRKATAEGDIETICDAAARYLSVAGPNDDYVVKIIRPFLKDEIPFDARVMSAFIVGVGHTHPLAPRVASKVVRSGQISGVEKWLSDTEFVNAEIERRLDGFAELMEKFL